MTEEADGKTHNMFAVVAFECVRAVACRNLVHYDRVYLASPTKISSRYREQVAEKKRTFPVEPKTLNCSLNSWPFLLLSTM